MARISDRQAIRQESTFPADSNPSLHDEIVAWIDSNALEVARNLFLPAGVVRISDAGWKMYEDYLREAAKEQQVSTRSSVWLGKASELTARGGEICPLDQVHTVWEDKIVKGEGKYKTLIGFIDLSLWARPCEVHLDWDILRSAYDGVRRFGETGPHWRHNHDPRRLNFEAKSSIRDVGSVIRQVKYYQTFLPESERRFAIVCPETRWAETIYRQGIEFIRYDPGITGESVSQLVKKLG